MYSNNPQAILRSLTKDSDILSPGVLQGTNTDRQDGRVGQLDQPQYATGT